VKRDKWRKTLGLGGKKERGDNERLQGGFGKARTSINRKKRGGLNRGIKEGGENSLGKTCRQEGFYWGVKRAKPRRRNTIPRKCLGELIYKGKWVGEGSLKRKRIRF